MEVPQQRAPFFRTALSSALTAACLNLAASVLDHPRALAGGLELGLPLAVTAVAFLAAACLVLAAGRALARVFRLDPGALHAALAAVFVLAALLHPLVEAGLRETSAARAGVVLGCALGLVVCAGGLAYALGARAAAFVANARTLAALPLVAAALLGVAWASEYHVAGGLARSALLVGFAALVVCARRAPAGALAFFALAVVGHGVAHAFLELRARPDAGERTAAPAARTPIVLITVDTLRADRVLGAERARVPTPALDALAADSVVFTQARSAAPWTKPALASLLTGLSPLVHGMTNRRAQLTAEIETLAERLRAHGYRTGGIGLNAHLERAFRFDQGFEHYAFPARLDYGVSLGARVLTRWAPARFPELFPSTTAIADAALAWLDAHADEPFFLWLHVLDPHWPYEPPSEWLPDPHAEPRRWGEPAMVTNVQAGNTKPGAEERARVEELYAGEIRYVDHELARVLGALRAHGVYERALVVFASDHGEEFWEHGRYEHGHTLYDEVLRVPLFFKLPAGAHAGRRIDAPVSTEALLATVLDELALPFDPELVTATSLAPWWRGATEPEAVPLFATGTYYFGEKRAVVFDGKKLVLELDTGRSELYDLAADPRELVPSSAAQPELVRAGLRLVDEWLQRCADVRARLGIVVRTAAPDPEIERMLHGLGYTGTD